MKIAIISLGCPKNQVDADVFCHALIKDGHTTVADPAEADIIIINTCGFIESAKAEAIENILMACQYKQQNPDLKVVVTGCLAERYKQQIVQEIPEVDAVVGIGSNAALPAIVRRLCAAGAGQIESYGPKTDMQLGGARVISTPRHYAYLKIAEGCNNRCHYCAIPLIRGPLRSREIKDCVAEARWLAGEGVKELILVAQDGASRARFASCWTSCRPSTASAGSACCMPILNVSPMNLSPRWSATPRWCRTWTCPSSIATMPC